MLRTPRSCRIDDYALLHGIWRALNCQPLLHLISVKYYLSSQWTQTCQLLWKILLGATQNISDSHFLWTSYTKSHYTSSPVLRKIRNYMSPTMSIFFFLCLKIHSTLHHAYCIMVGFWCRGCIGRRKWHFSPWSAFPVRLCLKAASEYLRRLIKPSVWLLSRGKLSGIRC